MKVIGNILWFIFTGLETAIAFFFAGIIWCITIIGIPFGVQCFKLARLALFPFGKKTDRKFSAHPIANIIWFIFGGFAFFIGYLIAGVLWCITILGIPFGKQCFKLCWIGAFPFGADVKRHK